MMDKSFTSGARLCMVGPMLGRNPGWVTTQGELLADQFTAEGWSVKETSHQPSRPLRLLDTVSSLVRWRHHVDLVVLSVFSGPSFAMADLTSRLTSALGIPTIMWLHGGNLPEFSRAHRAWVDRVLRRASLIVAPSTFLAEHSVRAIGPVEIIPNLIDLTALPFRRRSEVSPRLLWMRTFHPVYNPALAIRTLGRLRSHQPSATLTMAGQEKGLTAEMRSAAREMGLDDAVSFPGFLGAERKARAFDSHDIYLHTNHVDNTPVSVLEAAAAGLPIVATNVGGIPHLLEHEHTALLVPDDDEVAMAKAVERLLAEPDLAERLSCNARELAEASSWDSVRSQWERVFERVLGAD